MNPMTMEKWAARKKQAAHAAKAKQQAEAVNYPPHYTQGAVECIDAIESALGPVGFIEFLRGQVVRYTWRMSHKGKPLEDGQKMQWYSNLLVQKLAEATST